MKISSDYRHLAYVANSEDKYYAVIDGITGKQFDGIGVGTPIFSYDGMRVAYNAKSDGKCFAVVDGKEVKNMME